MSRNAYPWFGATLILALVISGCARDVDPESPDPAEEPVTITVQHDLPVATSLTVRLIDPTGSLRRLGTVRPGSTETFRLPDPVRSGEYRITAEVADGRSIESRPFVLTGRAGVHWSPSANVVRPD